MSTPISQMYEHGLNPLSGFDPLYVLYKYAKLSDDVLDAVSSVPAGRVAYLDSAGEFQLANNDNTVVNAGDQPNMAMPMFLWQGSHDGDVLNDGVSSSTGTTHWVAVNPSGVMAGIVATGGYELQSTEYNSDLTYTTNDPLTADEDDDGIAGRLTNASVTPYSDWICGVASWHAQGTYQDDAPTSPTGTNAHGVSTLSFWTYFLPASA